MHTCKTTTASAINFFLFLKNTFTMLCHYYFYALRKIKLAYSEAWTNFLKVLLIANYIFIK